MIKFSIYFINIDIYDRNPITYAKTKYGMVSDHDNKKWYAKITGASCFKVKNTQIVSVEKYKKNFIALVS